MILRLHFQRKAKEKAYAIVDRCGGNGLICYNTAWPSLYYTPTVQAAIQRHVAKRRAPSGCQWESGDMFLVFRMGKRPPVIAVIAMFERMDGSLTPLTITGAYPDDVKEILAHLRKET